MPYGSAFAAWYDLLTGEIDYPARANYFDTMIRQRYPVKADTILLDLACGTGKLSVEFSRLGYDVIGVDASEDMLCEAMAKGYGGEKPVLYLCQGMDSLDLYGTVDVTVCALDSLNHMTDPAKVRAALGKVGLFTSPGGLFIFDVNTEYKHREILGNQTFVYDLDDVYCVWQNSTDSSLLTEISLDFFVREGSRYRREEEQFAERAYSFAVLTGWLEEAGFELLDIYAGDTFSPVADTTQRAVFVARKKENQSKE